MRILFAIISCHKNNARRESQRITWVNRLRNEYFFFVGQGSSELLDDEVMLDCPDDYEGLPAKVQAVFKWALEQGYDYICKCDDDVYMYPERMLASDFTEFSYTGRINETTSPAHPTGYLSGFTYWVDKKSAKILAKATIPPGTKYEDVWVGSVLYAAGIKWHDEPRYTVLLPNLRNWHTILKDNPILMCQAEPDDMGYIHGLVTTGVIPKVVHKSTAVRPPDLQERRGVLDPRTGRMFERIQRKPFGGINK